MKLSTSTATATGVVGCCVVGVGGGSLERLDRVDTYLAASGAINSLPRYDSASTDSRFGEITNTLVEGQTIIW